MFGPLPRLHRSLLVLVTVLVGVAAGAWLGQSTPELLVSVGALAGGLSGIGLAWLLVHRPTPHAVRARHRR
ncbi:MAG: hypothetical protein R2731_16480 [Nocardioides sp.]